MRPCRRRRRSARSRVGAHLQRRSQEPLALGELAQAVVRLRDRLEHVGLHGRLAFERALDLTLGLLQSIDQRYAPSAALPRIGGAEGLLQELVDRGGTRGFLLRAVARPADLIAPGPPA